MAFQITKTDGIYEINVCPWSHKQPHTKRFSASFFLSLIVEIQMEIFNSWIPFYYKPEPIIIRNKRPF